jgi:hypothetical protein
VPAPTTHPAERPLRTYGLLVTLFVAVFGGVLARAAARGSLPERMSLVDIALAGVAGHKVSRIVAKEEVTAPVRSPFVEAHPDAEGRIVEEPAGGGPRRAVGKLLTCPSCAGQWATATFVSGLVVAPRLTRTATAIFAADAVSDFLHVAYRAARTRA